MRRFYVVLDNSADAETVADRLRLRGFAAEAVEPSMTSAGLVAIGSTLPDRWQIGAQMDLESYSGAPCVVATDNGCIQLMTPVVPNALASVLAALN